MVYIVCTAILNYLSFIYALLLVVFFFVSEAMKKMKSTNCNCNRDVPDIQFRSDSLFDIRCYPFPAKFLKLLSDISLK